MNDVIGYQASEIKQLKEQNTNFITREEVIFILLNESFGNTISKIHVPFLFIHRIEYLNY